MMMMRTTTMMMVMTTMKIWNEWWERSAELGGSAQCSEREESRKTDSSKTFLKSILPPLFIILLSSFIIISIIFKYYLKALEASSSFDHIRLIIIISIFSSKVTSRLPPFVQPWSPRNHHFLKYAFLHQISTHLHLQAYTFIIETQIALPSRKKIGVPFCLPFQANNSIDTLRDKIHII